MYTPTLARFMSRDPFSQDVDLLSDNNWFGRRLDAMEAQSYAYARSNPVNRVDPSGQQAVAAPGGPDICEDCECHKASILWDHRDVINVPGRRKCRVEITCQKGACSGLPGFTGEPTLKKDAQGRSEWVIPLCIQCGWNPIDLIFEHELAHALQFCSGKKIENCRSCKQLETEAHMKNCKLAFPNPYQNALYERCYRCGVNISCRQHCGNRDPYP
ncbi:MAG: hypothetical protein ACREHD_12270, partial [Pirellulales bacterium]